MTTTPRRRAARSRNRSVTPRQDCRIALICALTRLLRERGAGKIQAEKYEQ
jgi:hypothetical protein